MVRSASHPVSARSSCGASSGARRTGARSHERPCRATGGAGARWWRCGHWRSRAALMVALLPTPRLRHRKPCAARAPRCYLGATAPRARSGHPHFRGVASARSPTLRASVPPRVRGGMSRSKPIKQPVFGSSGKQCARCGRWFARGDCCRDYQRRRPVGVRRSSLRQAANGGGLGGYERDGAAVAGCRRTTTREVAWATLLRWAGRRSRPRTGSGASLSSMGALTCYPR